LKILFYLLLGTTLLLLNGCNDPNAWDCIKSSGDWTTEERQLPQGVNGIKTIDGLNIELDSQIPAGRYKVEGGKNLLEKVTADPNGQFLEVFNKNGCELARATPDALLMRLPLSQQWASFYLLGFGSLTNQDTLKAQNLRIDQYGAGKVNLTIDTDWIITDLNGNGDFELAGKTNNLQIFTAKFNRFNSSQCEAQKVYVYARGEQNITVRASNFLFVSMEGKGNVSYLGNPEVFIENKGGSGKVIPLR